MEYAVYKLRFKTDVHFGNGALSGSNIAFLADTLFSAMYIEAMKLECADSLLEAVKSGRVLFSDAFPYIGSSYYLPKPMIYVEPQDKGDSTVKKIYKKMKYIPAELFRDYLQGKLDTQKFDMRGLGKSYDQIMSSVGMADKDAEPYSVGTYSFEQGSGLYIIVGFAEDDDKYLFEDLMISLSYSGIGGKRSAGKGRFEFEFAKQTDALLRLFDVRTGRYMLLSTALPKEDELDTVIDGASYLLQRRSGFISSDTFAETNLKKTDIYTMQAGSCFAKQFTGDVYDVSGGRGSHPVYRYAKAIFMEV